MKIACPTNRPEDLTESSVCKLKPVIGTITSAPSLKTAADLAHMPPLQALQILRLQLKIHSLWNDNRKYTLIPTELQRNVPHDARIDYITGSSARDRLIIFQDYYDMDECFEYYSRNAQFIGGSMYDSRNWIVTNGFPERYWFLSHEVVEDYFLNRHWKIPRDLMLMPQSYDPSFKESENGSMLLDNPKLY
ncbi:hypothetical protein CLU79DRAFT_706317 [Phycomyces nitens]|nr:hypothetical protein CLU79DRAFT_706317 [Phycomyces nitens]